ncbi:MAG TPA: serine protease [Clostridia bacterium]|nr:serine protease [Clostridia bacterium]
MKIKSIIVILITTAIIFSFNPANASIFYSYGYFTKNTVVKFPTNLITLKQPVSYNVVNKQKSTNTLFTSNPNSTNSNSISQNKDTSTQIVNTSLSQEEKTLVELVNQERSKYNLRPLQVDENLCKVARLKAEDMRDNNYFSHTSPTYMSPFDMMKKFGINYYLAGENIALNSNVIKAHYSLMNSEGHRANILNPYYNKIGVGIVKNKEGNGIIVVEMFIKD